MKKIRKLCLFIIILLVGFIYFTRNKKSSYLDKVIFNNVKIEEYYIYGNHLNIKGSFELLEGTIKENIEDVDLVLKNDTNEITLDFNYSLSDNSFYTSDKLNEGIYLDTIEIGDYAILLKITYRDEDKLTDYYAMLNDTKYDDTTYYTITKDDKNNKVYLSTKMVNIDKEEYEYMAIDVSNNKDNDIYDIVIDPGHGGIDVGAVNDDYYESNLTLMYATKLAKKLEHLGLKVKLTRDTDISVDAYGENGRAVIPNNLKAKYFLSVHLNSTPYKMKYGGIEIYAPDNIDYTFAKSMANNIVNMAGTRYSSNNDYMIDDGIYVKYLTKDDIDESRSELVSKGITPYNIKNNTLYYFVIRETGGVMTNAYVDGRDEDMGKNPYYDSNIGAEAYLLELAFMSSDNDLNNFINNMDKYVDAVYESMKEELNIE